MKVRELITQLEKLDLNLEVRCIATPKMSALQRRTGRFGFSTYSTCKQ